MKAIHAAIAGSLIVGMILVGMYAVATSAAAGLAAGMDTGAGRHSAELRPDRTNQH